MGSRLIISGSPRAEGKSSYLAQVLMNAPGGKGSGEPPHLFSLAQLEVDPCIACDACKTNFSCIIDDEMQVLYPLLENADELVIVSPVYFAGPPAQLKAVLDRLQPYFWKSRANRDALLPKRPASLFVIGEGGDPHGFEPLIVSVRSALATAGFSLAAVYNGVGLDFSQLDDLAVSSEKFRHEPSDADNPGLNFSRKSTCHE